VLLGDADLQANDNPFNPQVICDAFKQPAGRRARLPGCGGCSWLFDDHVLDDVRSILRR
jgi:hypothetical protein